MGSATHDSTSAWSSLLQCQEGELAEGVDEFGRCASDQASFRRRVVALDGGGAYAGILLAHPREAGAQPGAASSRCAETSVSSRSIPLSRGSARRSISVEAELRIDQGRHPSDAVTPCIPIEGFQ